MKKSKTIWLIQQHSMPPELGHYNRQNNFGKYLKRDGYNPIAFAGSKLHNSDVQMIKDKRKYMMYTESECPFCFIKTCDYGNSRKKRIIAEIQFHWNLYRNRKRFPKPDVVLGSSSYMMSACLAIILAKKFKCKSIVEVRDLWPQTIVDYLGYSPKNPIIRILYQVEKWMYTHADELVFTMEGGKDYIVEHKLDKSHGGKVDLNKVHHINNGVDLEKFVEARDNNQFFDEDLADSDKICIVYTGSVRLANNIKYIVQIAKQFENTNVYFLIYGNGDEIVTLSDYCYRKRIHNIIFKGHVKKEYIPSLLSQADLLLLHFNQTEVIEKYGYSFNKYFDYLAAGKPIVSTVESKYEMVKSQGVGILCPNNDSRVASEMINEFINSNQRRKCEKIASKLAIDYDFKNLTNMLENIL